MKSTLRKRISGLTYHASHDTVAFEEYRHGLAEAETVDVPRISTSLVAVTLFGLLFSALLVMTPWVTYTVEDGTSGTASGLRTDGLIVIVLAMVAAAMVIVCLAREPGDGAAQATNGLVTAGLAFLTVGILYTDPGYMPIDTPEEPVKLDRAWGLHTRSRSSRPTYC